VVWHRYLIAMEGSWKLALTYSSMVACTWAGLHAVHVGDRCHPTTEEARAYVREIRGAIELYRVEHRGRCPASIAAVAREGLLPKRLRDPWGLPYAMRCESGPSFEVEVRSAGADGKHGSADDVVSS
jgi:hypothetical protein